MIILKYFLIMYIISFTALVVIMFDIDKRIRAYFMRCPNCGHRMSLWVDYVVDGINTKPKWNKFFKCKKCGKRLNQ